MTIEVPTLPTPLTPADCDLRDFPRIMINITRLLGSTFNTRASRNPLAWMIGHKLWYRSWHQVPAASLPDDDDELCYLAELGFDRVTWDNVRDIALHGWIRCNDGRIYHPVVADEALEAWARKLKKRHLTYCATIRKHNERNPESKLSAPNFVGWEALGRPDRIANGVTQKSRVTPPSKSRSSHAKKPSKGQGQGQGQGHSNNTLTGEAAKRGTRLPDDFVMPDEWITAAMEKRRITRAVAEREAEKFTLHFQAASGPTAKKVNWRLAWLKWSASIAPDRSRNLSNEGREYLGV